MNFIIPNDHTPHRTSARLIERALSLAPEAGRFSTPVEGFDVTRYDEPGRTVSCLHEPVIGIVLQGYKQATLGNEVYGYGAGSCLVSGVDMPGGATIVEASREKPFLGISLAVDPKLATELSTEIPSRISYGAGDYNSISVAKADPELLGALLRLADLLDKPEQIAVLAPLMIREIHYRVLIGPQGACLRAVNTLGSQGKQVAGAINWLRRNFADPLDISDLAARVDMARTTFHRHFKQITSMSPLQFQKTLRLYEAQRLMLTEGKDASSASLTVGYESPSQFNREYKRLFGEPPHRDIRRLRQERAS